MIRKLCLKGSMYLKSQGIWELESSAQEQLKRCIIEIKAGYANDNEEVQSLEDLVRLTNKSRGGKRLSWGDREVQSQVSELE